MKRKSVDLRRAAQRDIDEAIDFYVAQTAHDAAHRFIDEVERALDHLSRHPESGSPRYALELGLPGLRHWPVAGYPYLVFYHDRSERIDVWRVLHGERDIPAWLRAVD